MHPDSPNPHLIQPPQAQFLIGNLCFGGPNFDVRYATSVEKVYRRKLNTRGAHAWDAPNKPATPRL